MEVTRHIGRDVTTRYGSLSSEIIKKEIETVTIEGREFILDRKTGGSLPTLTIPRELSHNFKPQKVLVIGVHTDNETFIASKHMDVIVKSDSSHEPRVQKEMENHMEVPYGTLEHVIIIGKGENGDPIVINDFEGNPEHIVAKA